MRVESRERAPTCSLLVYPAEPRRAGDGCQRPLVPRSRCPPRLTPSDKPALRAGLSGRMSGDG
jgi:hypothetical protein